MPANLKSKTPISNKGLTSLVAELNRKFGNNAVTVGFPKNAEGDVATIARIPTGSFSLDLSLGGGIPVGRFTEISGAYSSTKTTQCLHIIRKAQELGYVCAFIDVEGTSDEPFIESLGINSGELLYSRPDGMEEACQLVLDLQRSGEVHVAVLDSIAAMSPNKEQSSSMEETVRMGVPQQILSEFFRKYQANNNRLGREGKKPFTLIGVNQLREKIGAYGDPEYCLHYDTLINFVDGRSIPIGEVVDKKIKGEVWAFDTHKGKFVPANILDWKNNGNIETDREYYTIIAQGVGSKNGRFGITVTYDHLVYTDTGWKEAQCLSVSDNLVTRYEKTLNGTYADFMYGTLVGDSTVVHSHENTALIRFADSENPEYLEWKLSKIRSILPLEKYPNSNIYRSSPSVELALVKNNLGDRNPYSFISHYSDLGLAVWYMDDGYLWKEKQASISIKRMSKSFFDSNNVVLWFKSVGLDCKLSKSSGNFIFTRKSSEDFFDRIYRYIPECMQYKLPEEYRGRYVDFTLSNMPEMTYTYCRILSVGIASKRKLRKKGRYDIHVANYHNFLAGGVGNGVVVHNTPGGRAKGFAASVDIRFRRGDWIAVGTNDNKEFVGQVVKFKIEKNKTFKRMQTGEFDFYFAENEAGIPVFFNDENKEIIMSAVEWGLIEKAGAWFNYEDTKYQGLAKLLEAMTNDEALVEEMKKKIMYLAYRKND